MKIQLTNGTEMDLLTFENATDDTFYVDADGCDFEPAWHGVDEAPTFPIRAFVGSMAAFNDDGICVDASLATLVGSIKEG